MGGKCASQHAPVNEYVFTPAVCVRLNLRSCLSVDVCLDLERSNTRDNPGRRYTTHAGLYVSWSDRKINTVRGEEERKARLFEVRELQSGAERQMNHPVSET